MIRPVYWTLPFTLAVLGVLGGCSSLGAGDDQFRPLVGQQGKDVMWVPTLDYAVITMLERAQVTAGDIVYDLGAGDGRIPIEAARRYGARAVGIEYDGKLASLAQRNTARAGVSDRVRIIHGDIFKEDFSSATVLTLYLGRELNLKLKPTILRMVAGTRVVSNNFDMGLWEPDDVIRDPKHNNLYYWVVPARVDGEWEVSGPGQPTTLRLRQRFQKVEGTLVTDRFPSGIAVEGRLHGTRLVLRSTPQGGGAPIELRADVAGATLSGELGDGTTLRAVKRR
jgi:hypothetical protein